MFPFKETFIIFMKLNKNDLKAKFEVSFLEEARDFLDGLGEKERKKIIYNIDKAKVMNDPELFKKLTDIVWEFRTLYRNTKYRLLAFWDKENNKNTLVIVTHGLIKKKSKVPQTDIDKTEDKSKIYFKQKNKKTK